MNEKRERVKRVIEQRIWDYRYSDVLGQLKREGERTEGEALAMQTCVDEAEVIVKSLLQFGLFDSNQNEIFLHYVNNTKCKFPPESVYEPDVFGSTLELLALFREFVLRNVVVWKIGAGNHGHPIWSALSNAITNLDGFIEFGDPDLDVYLEGTNRRPLNVISHAKGHDD